MDEILKVELNIKNSINTDTINEDFKNISDPAAPLLANTGIERDGGITNQYELQTDYPEVGQYTITDGARTISVINSSTADYKTIKIDGKAIGQVSAYGVEQTITVAGVNDVFITPTSYVTCSLVDNIITVSEYDYSEALLNTRDITFTNLGPALTFFTSLSFVRWEGMAYADSLEWSLRLGDQVVILQESDPTITVPLVFQSTDVLGSSGITCSIEYNGWLVFAGYDGRVGSFDGVSWKKWDGSGTGLGLYNAGDAVSGVIGNNMINCMVEYNGILVVAGDGGRLGSYYNGAWSNWDSGASLTNNGTVVSTDAITAMAVYDGNEQFTNVSKTLIVGSALGKLGSYYNSSWYNYNATATIGAVDNNTLLAGAINSIGVYDRNGVKTIVVCGNNGRVASMRILDGTSVAAGTVGAPGGVWSDVCYAQGLFAAVANSTSTTASIATSTNGINWNFKTLPSAPAAGWVSIAASPGLNSTRVAVAASTSTTASIIYEYDGVNWNYATLPSPPAGNWTSVSWGNGKFIAVANSTSTTASMAESTDGITWTFITNPAPAAGWIDIEYGNGTWVAVAASTSTTAAIFSSTDDGATWVTSTTTAPGGNFQSVVYGNGRWVIAAASTGASTGLLYSYDGLCWNYATTAVPGAAWKKVGYGDGRFIATAGANTTTTAWAYSDDAITWTFATTIAPGAGGWGAVAYGKKVFVSMTALTTANQLVYSQPGTTINQPYNTKRLYSTASSLSYPTNNGTAVSTSIITSSIQYGDMFVIAGSSGRMASFKDGYWQNYDKTRVIQNPVLYSVPGIGANIISAAYNGNTVIALSRTSSTTAGIARSTDGGLTWSFVTTTAPGGAWQSIAYGNGVWVATAVTTSTTAGIARSTDDGLTWNFVTTTAPGNNWANVSYGNGVWIAVATTTSTTAGIARSTDDGLTWNFVTTTAPAAGWLDIAYGDGVWVATALTTSTTAGIARSTDDGLTWSFVTTTAPAANWNYARYGDGVWVAMAGTTSTTAGIARSTNGGATWTFVTTTAPGGAWSSLSYSNGHFVVVANAATANNTIAYSDNGGASFTFMTTAAVAYNWYSSANIGTGVLASTNTGTALNTYAIINTPLFVSDSGTNMGSQNIATMAEYNGYLVVAGGQGRVASIGPTLTKQAYNSGSIYSNNSTILRTNSISSLTEYDGDLWVSGSFVGAANPLFADNTFIPLYYDGSTLVANLLAGFNTLGYLYTYRYENGLYLVNLVGNSLSKSYTLNNSTKEINILRAKYCVKQVSSNKTRHITTANDTGYSHIYTGSAIQASGLTGYTNFSTFSGPIVYPTAAYQLGNGNVLNSQAGWGVSDFTFRLVSSATNVFNYVPQYQKTMTSLYQVVQSNSNTLINAYGKLTNNLGVAPTKPFEFRVCWTNGVQSYFSAALLDNYATDALGTVITNVGEIDDLYQPMIVNDDTILYSFNDKFIIKKVGTNIDEYVQKIADGIYKINSISPLNIIDVNSETLELGSIDFNNRMLFTSTAAPSTSTKVASIIEGKYANSVDTGEKLITITPATSSNIEILGYRVPALATNTRSYSVDTYFNSIYSFSTLNDGSELSIGDKEDLIYIANTNLPVALGLIYTNGTVANNGSTIFLKSNYDGYSIGNDIEGNYVVFTLYGQLYLYDQKRIYAATVNQVTGIFESKVELVSAPGLQYIATSPTMIYFLSSFDNSIYTFNGGRTLDKFKRMNQLPAINSGIFNTHDNSLVLDTDTSFIWVRDNIVSSNDKAVDQTNLKYYDTSVGIIIGNNTSNWRYTYEELPGSTVVPLRIQTSYFGLNTDEFCIHSEYLLTIYNEDKTRVVIDGTIHSVGENDFVEQPVSWVINPADYYNGGYARVRVQPTIQRSLGTSLTLRTNEKVIIVSVIAYLKKDALALVAKTRSR